MGDEELVIRPNPLQPVLAIVVLALMAWLGAGMLGEESLFGRVAGWGAIVVALLGLPAVALFLIPGATGLRLDPIGIVVFVFMVEGRIKWQDVANFRPLGYFMGMVKFDLIPATDGPPNGSDPAARRRQRTGMLPGWYGRSARHLADLLEEWRSRHLESTSEDAAEAS